MKKRLLSIVTAAALVLTVLCSVVGTVSAAEGDPAGVNFTVSTVQRPEFKAGEEITLNVTMSGAAQVAALQVKLSYDPEFLKAKTGAPQGALAHMDEGFKLVNPSPVDAPNEVWITGMSLENQAAVDGAAIATVTFEVIKDITADSAVSVSYAKVCTIGENEDGTSVVVNALPDGEWVPGGLKIGEEVANPGDANGDGKVNIFDVIWIQRYLARDPEVTLSQADANGDEKVNIFDVIWIQRFLARDPDVQLG